jgi:hypothetical protein
LSDPGPEVLAVTTAGAKVGVRADRFGHPFRRLLGARA